MDFEKYDYDNIVVTGFNNFKDFFSRGLNLIAGLHRTSINSIDQIFVFNLGFDDKLKAFLNSLEKVTVLEFPKYLSEKYYPEFLTPSFFSWKCYVLWIAKDLGKNILWLDSGIVPLKDIGNEFDIIEREDCFFSTLLEPNYNRRWTTPLALQLMNASENEMNDLQVGTNIYGYKANSKYQSMVDTAFEYGQKKEIMSGDKRFHRSEQSVYSILASRYGCKKYPYEIYGDTSITSNPGQRYYAHRGRVNNIKGLIYKKNYTLSEEIKKSTLSLYRKLANKRVTRYFLADILRKLGLYSYIYKKFRE